MSQNILIPTPLSARDFAPFGDVIEKHDQPKTINYGHTLRHDSPAALDLNADNGRAGISIFRSTPLPAPLLIEVMERHPLSTQTFYPLGKYPYLVVVARKGDFEPASLRAFIATSDQGVNYHAGVWHHYVLALNGISDFLVVDRIGPGENCDEVHLSPNLTVELRP